MKEKAKTGWCCECCGRRNMKPFGKAGDPLVGDFDGALLVKTFRENSGIISASWECRNCIVLSDKDYFKKIFIQSKGGKKQRKKISKRI